MFKNLALTLSAAMLIAVPALAQQTLKIGYVTTLTGPAAPGGKDMRDGFELAVENKNRMLGGLKTEVIYVDEQTKPEVGKQLTDKLIESDKVDFLSGYPFTNVLLASMKSAIDGKTFIIGNNAAPSQLAGEACSPWFFTTSTESDQKPMAMGQLLNRKGIKNLFIVSPNYTGGKNMVTGLKLTYAGKVVGEEYPRWPSQLDFSVELTKIRDTKPDAVWVFMPGNYGVQFFTQYVQSGLLGKIPIYSFDTINAVSLPLMGSTALGVLSTESWVEDLDNPTNKKFVADFRNKFKRTPSFWAAYAYDGALLIDSAVRAVKGDLTNKDALRNALRHADFESTRGRLKFGNNHFLIQNIYVTEVVKAADGSLALRTVETIVPNSQDIHHDKCPMNW